MIGIDVNKTLLCTILIASCFSLTGCLNAFKPQAGPVWMKDILEDTPPGPEMFRLGWKDGCQTGISATGNHIHKLHYDFTQQYQYLTNHEYYTGWKISWSYCQRYMFQFFLRNHMGL